MLNGLQQQGLTIPPEVQEASKLTVYATLARYPGLTAPATQAITMRRSRSPVMSSPRQNAHPLNRVGRRHLSPPERVRTNLHPPPHLNDTVGLDTAPPWEVVPWKEARGDRDGRVHGSNEGSSIGKRLREKGSYRESRPTMTDFDANSYSDEELHAEFDRLFPQGFAGPDVLQELAPGGWENSPLLAVFHPSVDQFFEETLRFPRNMVNLRTPGDDRAPCRPNRRWTSSPRSFQERPIEVEPEVRDSSAPSLGCVLRRP